MVNGQQNRTTMDYIRNYKVQYIRKLSIAYLKMKENNVEQNEDNFKVAPIISDIKLNQFKSKLLSTLIGLSTYAHYEFNEKTQQQMSTVKIVSIITYFFIPILIIIPNSVIASWELHALAVLIPTVLSPVVSLIADIIADKPKQIHRYIFISIYSYLWAVHFFISRQLFLNSYIEYSTYASILILSIITVLTSSSTICYAPVRQFSASTFDYQEFNIHSTLYVRFYVVAPILLTETALYYSPMASIAHPALPSLQVIASLSFLLWLMGLISSFYNNLLFVVNNLFNCLIFGEQITHSGNNYRGHHVWWVPFLTFSLNFISIGANLALVLGMQSKGQLQSKIVQSQHVFLVSSAMFTILLSSGVVYFSYRCSKSKQQLIRLDKFNSTQVSGSENQNKNIKKQRLYEGKCFFGHKQILNLIAIIIVPVVVCLLAILAFYQFYNAYGMGQKYDPFTFFPEKTVTWIILAIDVAAYLLFVIFKEISRARSKLGFTICPGIFKLYTSEVERDFFFKLILRVTGALAIMVLTLRIQNLQIFSWKIISRTPISPVPHPYLTFFISYIIIPVLIYRSYKRSQIFSHFFHITIIASLILTLMNSTLYLYQSIFVVMAMPNFPQNPFRLLLISPFTIPQKLIHKNQNKYRIGYLLVNTLTFFVYLFTLGTLQFTMIFGLPMYWCVLPSINCQSGKKKENKSYNIEERDSKIVMSEFETTNQNFKIESQINRSTPEHNLYEKIVSEIPFYIFRNKRPGYYLLRISKYILLVEVIADFYGLFQTVSIIGLETQQVTTCHAKEGQTLDRIVDYTWSDNPQNHEWCACDDSIKTILHQQHRVKGVKITSENEIQLTGVIESAQFYNLFKKCLIKALVFQYNKLLQDNPKNQLTSQQAKQAEVLLQDLYGRVNKQKIDQIFPYQFLQKNKFLFEAKFKQSSNKFSIRKKLPPIGKKQQNKKKQKIIDDFADLVGGNSDIQLKNSSVEQKKQTIDIDKIHQESFTKQNQESNQKIDKSSLHMAVIISAYLAIIGKINYLNPDRLYKLLKKDSSVLSQFEFKAGLDLVSNAVGCALKIAIGKQLQAETDVQFQDFTYYDQNQYLGTLESSGFSQAISSNKQDIWTVSYNQTKKMLAVKRLAKNQTAMYMFSLETHAVQAVWNNLRFQLLFATNDNDERYSIQTHQYLLRNLLVQGCEQPYGYAGYYSEEFINL